MSFYYEVVNSECKVIKNKWYFNLIEFITGEMNIVIDDEIILFSNGEIIFSGIVRNITENKNIFRIYCKNKELDKLEGSGIRIKFDVNPEFSVELNKTAMTSFNCSNDIYSVIDEGNYLESYVSVTGRIFFGKITKISNKSNNLYEVKSYDLLNDLMRVYARKIYYDTSIENIVKDLLDTYFPNLEFHYIESGEVLEKFFIDDYIYNTIKFLATGIGYVINMDGNILEFKPYEYIHSEFELNKNIGKITSIEKSTADIVNDIWIFGDSISISTDEEFIGDSETVEFELDYAISGSVKVLINDVEIETDMYSIDDYAGKIIFDTAPATNDIIKIEYDYSIPISVHLKDDESIAEYGMKSKKYTVSSIKSFDVARNLAKQYIQMFKEPKLTINIKIRIDTFLTPNLKVGMMIYVNLPEKGITEKLIIKKISIRTDGYIDVSLGRDDRDIISWYSDVESRISELERMDLNKLLFNEYSYSIDDIKVNVNDGININLYKRIINDLTIRDNIYAIMGGENYLRKFGIGDYASLINNIELLNIDMNINNDIKISNGQIENIEIDDLNFNININDEEKELINLDINDVLYVKLNNEYYLQVFGTILK